MARSPRWRSSASSTTTCRTTTRTRWPCSRSPWSRWPSRRSSSAMLRDRVVVVGVSGGIAAYKACELVRRLRDRNATVLVVMTPAASEFVTPLTFQALSGNPVVTTLWGDQRPRFDLPLESGGKAPDHAGHVDGAAAGSAAGMAPARPA